MKTTSQKIIYTTLLTIAVISNFAFGRSTVTGDELQFRITMMDAIGDNIFAGTASNGVYRSVDGGKVWAPVNNGLPQPLSIQGMATSGKNIFIVGFSQPRTNLYSSGDNGLTWKEVTNCPVPMAGITSFKDKLFAATREGFYESTDHGAKWTLVPAIVEKEMTTMVATKDRVFVWSRQGPYTNVFYTTTDGIKWTLLKDQGAMIGDVQVHGNNILTTWCQNTEQRWDGQTKCLSNHMRVLSKNGKEWEEEVKLKPREFVFSGDNIYAITVDLTESKKKGVGCVREVLMSDNRGKSWKKVDENTDAFVVSDYDMQEKLTELKVWEPIEIAEREAMLQKQKLAAEEYAAAQAKARKAQRELDAKYEAEYKSSASSPSGIKQPDYRAMSNDRFNAMHNTKSYIDSNGGMHIR